MNYNAFKNLNHGVYIVSSVNEDGKRVGFAGNSAMQITNNPITVAISVNHDSYSNYCIKKSKKFAISVLSETTAPSIIANFGFSSSKENDKFEGLDIREVDGLTVIMDACSYITCKVIDALEAPTHTIFLGRVINADTDTLNNGEPMTYEYYHKVLGGKEPEKSPTFKSSMYRK